MKREPPTMLIAKVDPEFKDLVEKEAKKQDITVSELIRRTLAQRLNYQMDEDHVKLLKGISTAIRGVIENRRIIIGLVHDLKLLDRKEMKEKFDELTIDLEIWKTFIKYLEAGDYVGGFNYLNLVVP